MQLLSTLQEASSIPIDDLQKVMKKDKRIKQVFQKTLDLNDIENKVEFLSTLKFFLQNNRNVLDFVEGRDYVKDVDKRTLKKLRELKPTELKQRDIDDLLTFVVDLFREHSYVERSGMTPGTRKEIIEWANKSGRYFNLTSAAQREIISLPNVRPTRPILLYRGLLFNSTDLKERKRYDGQLEVGDGLKFLRSVREGSRIVDLDWDRASSWSTSKEVAMRFARFRASSSSFDATMNWLSRKDHIDGDLGFVISTLAQPEDVLIDMHRLVTSAHMKHGDEAEVILKPGSYRCRVSVKMTKEGEVDPLKTAEVDDSLNSAVEAVREFARTWQPPQFEELKTGGWRDIEVDRALQTGEGEKVVKLAQRDVKEQVLASYKEFKEFYDEHLANLPPASLETLQANPKIGKVVEWIVNLRKEMNANNRHPAFKAPQNSRGDVKTSALTPEQFRETAYATVHSRFNQATAGGRYTDNSVGYIMNQMLKSFGGEVEKDLHRRGRKDQEEHTNKTVDAFLRMADVKKPESQEEAVKLVKNALLAAERNASLASKLLSWRKSLDEVTGTATEQSE